MKTDMSCTLQASNGASYFILESSPAALEAAHDDDRLGSPLDFVSNLLKILPKKKHPTEQAKDEIDDFVDNYRNAGE